MSLKQSIKKKNQLGESHGTAQHRLLKDILWMLILETGKTRCFCCGQEMTRETFSIEHKTPWLDSSDPIKLFFDLDNISFSHFKCNVKSARRKQAECGTVSKYKKGCRCDPCKSAKSNSRVYDPIKRRDQYTTYGT